MALAALAVIEVTIALAALAAYVDGNRRRRELERRKEL